MVEGRRNDPLRRKVASHSRRRSARGPLRRPLSAVSHWRRTRTTPLTPGRRRSALRSTPLPPQPTAASIPARGPVCCSSSSRHEKATAPRSTRSRTPSTSDCKAFRQQRPPRAWAGRSAWWAAPEILGDLLGMQIIPAFKSDLVRIEMGPDGPKLGTDVGDRVGGMLGLNPPAVPEDTPDTDSGESTTVVTALDDYESELTMISSKRSTDLTPTTVTSDDESTSTPESAPVTATEPPTATESAPSASESPSVTESPADTEPAGSTSDTGDLDALGDERLAPSSRRDQPPSVTRGLIAAGGTEWSRLRSTIDGNWPDHRGITARPPRDTARTGQTATRSAMSARRRFLSSLPTGVLGISSTHSRRSGHLNLATPSASMCSCTCGIVSGSAVATR